MRLFVAFELPEALRREVGDLVERLRPGLPAARWVPPANLHLTLVFLGEVAEAALDSLHAVLETAFAEWAPGRLRLSGGGAFPPRRPARVVWIGFEPAAGLPELQARLAADLATCFGRETEGRPFHPHLTLGRCRRPWPRGAADRWARSVPAPLGEAFAVERGSLVRSRLGPGGAQYETVRRYPLAGTRCLD